MDDIIKEASEFAFNKHKGQLDDEGKTYYGTHLYPMAMMVKQLTTDEEIIAATYLHDTIEDCGVSHEELVKKFGKRIADLVNEVTHDGTNDAQGYFFPRLKSKEAIMIKLIDRASNISRMESWNDKRQAHYLKSSIFWRTK